jgi:iron complex outermembrane receptor protein
MINRAFNPLKHIQGSSALPFRKRTLLAFECVMILATLRSSAADPAPVGPSDSPTLTAQTNESKAAAQAKESEQIIELSKFEVITTQDHGYRYPNSASGFKTNESLMDIPQSLTVLTQDLIKDLSFANTSDITQYAGIATSGVSESNKIRGGQAGYAFIDEMNANAPYNDNFFIDTYEVLRGPAQVLYINAGAGGAVLASTKRPLPFHLDTITVGIDSWGTYRAVIDSTGPLGKIGDAKIGYRLAAVTQGGQYYYTNVKDDRNGVFLELQVDFKDTTARVYVVDTAMKHATAWHAIYTPTGELYTGGGRDNSFIPSKNAVMEEAPMRLFAEIDSRVSENWEVRFKASEFYDRRKGMGCYPNTYDWVTKTADFIDTFYKDVSYEYWNLAFDVKGDYYIGPRKNIDVFGFAWSEQSNVTQTLAGASIGFHPLAVPLTIEGVNAVQVPDPSAFTDAQFGSTGGRYAQVRTSQLYWQHTLEVIPKWVNLVGGLTWTAQNGSSVANKAIVPWTASVTHSNSTLHRLGVVIKPIKEISLYALESTQYSPPASNAILQDGSPAPGTTSKGSEVGIKTSFFDGKLSADLSIYQSEQDIHLQIVPATPTTLAYYVVLPGGTKSHGYDGSIGFSAAPGFQVIGSFYNGRTTDLNGNPVIETFENSWTLFGRYDFPKSSPLHGLSIGGGPVRIGGYWAPTAGISNADNILTAYEKSIGGLKLKPGTLINMFLTYRYNNHLTFRLNCDNVLDEDYIVGTAGQATFNAGSVPRTFLFSTEYTF